jgi:hypothetical protein
MSGLHDLSGLSCRWHQVVPPNKDGVGKIYLLVRVAQAYEAVGVHHGKSHYRYPVLAETGIARESRGDLTMRKIPVKSDD